MRRLIALLMALPMAATVASPAVAQTALTAPSIKWAGQWTTSSPTSVIGYDSATGSPCIVGSSATCAVPTSGGGGINVSVSASATITSGGTAQTIAGGIPANGYEICNPDVAEELWVSDLATAIANGTGSYRVGPNGGCYVTPTGARPAGSISVIAATTGHKMTIRTW